MSKLSSLCGEDCEEVLATKTKIIISIDEQHFKLIQAHLLMRFYFLSKIVTNGRKFTIQSVLLISNILFRSNNTQSWNRKYCFFTAVIVASTSNKVNINL
jgi:hypothetical protein